MEFNGYAVDDSDAMIIPAYDSSAFGLESYAGLHLGHRYAMSCYKKEEVNR